MEPDQNDYELESQIEIEADSLIPFPLEERFHLQVSGFNGNCSKVQYYSVFIVRMVLLITHTYENIRHFRKNALVSLNCEVH